MDHGTTQIVCFLFWMIYAIVLRVSEDESSDAWWYAMIIANVWVVNLGG